MRREELLPYIEEIVTVLRPACERIEIAGGIRRGKPEPHDAEIVALPNWEQELFGGDTRSCPMLDAVLHYAVGAGFLRYDELVKRNGPLYKRFVLPCCPEVAVDLFLATHDNYGNTLAIRTGDADFSHEMMIAAVRRGQRQLNGYLWWVRGGKADIEGEGLISCPTEEAYFEAIGWPWVEPAARNIEMARRLSR